VPFHEPKVTALLSVHKYTALELFIFRSALHTNIKLNVKLNSEYFKHTAISHRKILHRKESLKNINNCEKYTVYVKNSQKILVVGHKNS